MVVAMTMMVVVAAMVMIMMVVVVSVAILAQVYEAQSVGHFATVHHSIKHGCITSLKRRREQSGRYGVPGHGRVA